MNGTCLSMHVADRHCPVQAAFFDEVKARGPFGRATRIGLLASVERIGPRSHALELIAPRE